MAQFIYPIDDPSGGAITALALRICASSNFSVATGWFQFNGIDPTSETDIRKVIGDLVSDPVCHEFLRPEREPLRGPLEVFMPHQHFRMLKSERGFEQTVASAAADHLGAYSKDMTPASLGQIEKIRNLFSTLGPYHAFELVPGNEPGCRECTYDSHLFSNWFWAVAWDWCFVVTWPASETCLVLCLTDTD